MTIASPRRFVAARRIGRRAFTLIEVLVVVGIIGVLTGLLLPAVQAARESGRRLQCVANLRQIGVAMHAYNAVHDMFPPGDLMNGRGVGFSDNHLSELLYLLPHLEQGPLYNAFNMSFATVEWPSSPTFQNRTVRNTRLSVFLCPSDGEPRLLNSYRFNRGRLDPRPLHRFDGPFSFAVLPRPAAITDGLSNTAFVSERIAGSFQGVAGHPPQDIQVPLSPIFKSDDQIIEDCMRRSVAFWFKPAGRYWHVGGFAYGHYNHNAPPNDPRPSCAAISEDGDSYGGGLSPPRSYHSGGVNVLHGDGHVAAATNSIDVRVWKSLGTYNSSD